MAPLSMESNAKDLWRWELLTLKGLRMRERMEVGGAIIGQRGFSVRGSVGEFMGIVFRRLLGTRLIML